MTTLGDIDQRPSGGCEKCGKWNGEPQHILKKRLKRVGGMWLCAECRKDTEK